MRFWKRLLCRHRWTWIRNIYGDEIIECGWNRSLWWCDKCHMEQFRKEGRES